MDPAKLAFEWYYEAIREADRRRDAREPSLRWDDFLAGKLAPLLTELHELRTEVEAARLARDEIGILGTDLPMTIRMLNGELTRCHAQHERAEAEVRRLRVGED